MQVGAYLGEKIKNRFLVAAIHINVVLISVGCAQLPETIGSGRALGPARVLGNGTVASYAEFEESGAPAAIGVVFSADGLEGLPSVHSDGNRCFDANQNGSIEMMTECSHWHEFVLPLPSDASTRADIPFKWALVNWNPYGHIPPGVWDTEHYDAHFYIEPIETIFALQRGTCGIEFIRCDQYEKAIQPVPANYIHPDYEDVGAAAPAMGNHLIDPSAPEFSGEPFERHWIFGAYEGRIIFYEEMVSRSFMLTQPDACSDIKTPEAVALTGYYPTRSCVRYAPGPDEYTISMENFILREASPPSH